MRRTKEEAGTWRHRCPSLRGEPQSAAGGQSLGHLAPYTDNARAGAPSSPVWVGVGGEPCPTAGRGQALPGVSIGVTPEQEAEAEAVLAALATDPLPPGPYLVCARTLYEVRRWAVKHGVIRQDWRFVDDDWQVHGAEPSTLVLLNGQEPYWAGGVARIYRLRIHREQT